MFSYHKHFLLPPFAKLLSGIFVKKFSKSTIRRTFQPQNKHNVHFLFFARLDRWFDRKIANWHTFATVALTGEKSQIFFRKHKTRTIWCLHADTKSQIFDENSGLQFCIRRYLRTFVPSYDDNTITSICFGSMNRSGAIHHRECTSGGSSDYKPMSSPDDT